MTRDVQVLVDGSIYSAADPYATAMVIEEGMIQWVGQDAGAQSILDESMKVCQLEGNLVTPAFITGGFYCKSEEDIESLVSCLRNNGYAGAVVFCSANLVEKIYTSMSRHSLQPFIYVEVDHPRDVVAVSSQAWGVWSTSVGLLEEIFQESLKHKLKIVLKPVTSLNLKQSLKQISLLNPLERLKLAPRIDAIVDPDSEDLQQFVKLGISLGISHSNFRPTPLMRTAIATGINVVLGNTADAQQYPQSWGWALAQQYVEASSSETQVSARAVFGAMTRGVYRALGESAPRKGQLVPGAPSQYAQWEVEELMVQTPDSRVAAWSTDPRARIPLLPALDTSRLPHLVRTVLPPSASS